MAKHCFSLFVFNKSELQFQLYHDFPLKLLHEQSQHYLINLWHLERSCHVGSRVNVMTAMMC